MSFDSDPGRGDTEEPGSKSADGQAAIGSEAECTLLLRVVAGARSGEFIPLKAGMTRVGRAASNDLVIQSRSVSRYHAWIVVDEQGVLVFNHSATNPTLVRNRIITAPTGVFRGDTITIGDTVLEVLELDAVDTGRLTAGPLGSDEPETSDPESPTGVDIPDESGDVIDVEMLASRTIELDLRSGQVIEIAAQPDRNISRPRRAAGVDTGESDPAANEPSQVQQPDDGSSAIDRIKAALHRERKAGKSVAVTILGLTNGILALLILALIARLLGGSSEGDAVYAIQGLVDLMVIISYGLSKASMSTYQHLRLTATGKKTPANSYLWSFSLAIAAVFAVVAVVATVLASQLAWLLAPGATESRGLVIEFVRIIFIGFALVAFDAGLRVLLHSNRSPLTTGLARLAANLVIIGAVVILAPSVGPTAIVVGAVAGLLFMVVLEAARAASLGLLAPPTFSLDKTSRQVLWGLPGSLFILAWPLAVLMVDRASASYLDPGSVAFVGYGSGIAMIAVGISFLPRSTRDHLLLVETTMDRSEQLGRQVARALQTVWTIVIPVSTVVYLARFDLVAVLLEGGAFGPDEVLSTAAVLGAYTLALPGFAVVVVLRHAVVAVNRSKRVPAFMLAGLPITAVANAVMIDSWGLAGVAVSTGLVSSLAALFCLAVVLSNGAVSVGWRWVIDQTATIALAAAAAGIIAVLVANAFMWAGYRSSGTRLAVVCLTAAVAYMSIGWMLKIGPIRLVLTRFGGGLGVSRAWDAWRPTVTFLVSRTGPIVAAAVSLLLAVLGAAVVGAALAVVGGRLAGLETMMLAGAIVGLPFVLSLRSQHGFDRMVFVALLIFGVVYLEPAPVDGLVAVLLAVGVVQGHLDRSRLWDGLPVVVSVGVLLALSLIAGMGADAPISSLRFTIITAYCVSIMFFVRMYGTSTGAVDRMIQGYVIGGVVAVLAEVASLMGLISGSEILEGGRARGFTQDANVFGPFLVIGMFLAIDQIRRHDLSALARRLYVAAALVSAVGVFLTFSRAAWGNTVITALVYLVLAGRTFSRKERVRAIGFLLALSFLVVVTTFVTGQVDLLAERASFVQSYDNKRFAAQQEGILFGLNYPLGIGPGMTDFGDRFAPHNSYIRAFAETGLAGLLALLAVYWSTLVPVARRVRLSSRYLGVSSQVLVAITVGQLANGFLIDTLHWRHFWFLFGLLWIQHDRLQRRSSDLVPSSAPSVAKQSIGASL